MTRPGACGTSACNTHWNTLFNPAHMARNFSNIAALFPTKPLRPGQVSRLPKAAALTLPSDAARWITESRATALVVLKGGKICHESYHLGTGENDLRMSWSVAKSFLSILTGILDHAGALPPLDAPVERTIPALAQSGYAGNTLQSLLQMTSGVAFNEDYLDPTSQFHHFMQALTTGASTDAEVASLTQRHARPGAVWTYASPDTHVIGMVLRAATGQSITDLMSTHLTEPLGLEAAPRYVTDAHGAEFVLGGLLLRARDYAQFGQMIAQGGVWQGRQIVPETWVRAATAPKAATPPGAGYGYQWWTPPNAAEGECLASGIYGQRIYVNPGQGGTGETVITVSAANPDFSAEGSFERSIALFREIAAC